MALLGPQVALPLAEGQFVKVYTRRFEGKPEIVEAKSLGALEALQWLTQEQLTNV
jgi:hypothetical protein